MSRGIRVEKIYTNPTIEIACRDSTSLDNIKRRLSESRISLLLKHPLAQMCLNNMGKLVILYLIDEGEDDFLYLLTLPELIDRVLSDWSVFSSLARLGELYYETVKRSGILLPLLDVEELIPIIPIPEYETYRNRERLVRTLNLEEELNIVLNKLVVDWLKMKNIDVKCDTYIGALLYHLGHVNGKRPRILTLYTSIGLVPFFKLDHYGEVKYGYLGKRDFTSLEELVNWYLSKQYLHDISRAIIGSIVLNLDLSAMPNRYRNMMIITDFASIVGRYFPARKVISHVNIIKNTSSGGKDFTLDISSILVEDVSNSLTLIELDNLEVYSTDLPIRLRLRVDLPLRDVISFPILLLPRSRVNMRLLFLPIYIISDLSTRPLLMYLTYMLHRWGRLLVKEVKDRTIQPEISIEAWLGKWILQTVTARLDPSNNTVIVDPLSTVINLESISTPLLYVLNSDMDRPMLLFIKNVKVSYVEIVREHKEKLVQYMRRILSSLRNDVNVNLIVIDLLMSRVAMFNIDLDRLFMC